ncbi:fasciclin-like arabinogalactan protein 14 [Solanum pennellii]|uniref:Fasciclin-like arabinogalactan protein 14 n=1 Tax=Solanum pennellii TaxID=28526 RepID=A0ABM1VFR7_SOLPN|nr:fasciclin-like arabinogalactan protein 14 [Solanum pennellii]
MVNFNTSLVTFFFFLLLLSRAKSFNITSLLNHYSSFSSFNNYLTQSGVAAEINSRRTLTVLVVENNKLSPLKGMSQDAIANVMRVHVLLDYYDVPKMQMLPNKTMKTPTLFQTTGYANNDQGFLNMTDLGVGSISLGSAAEGERLESKLIKSIASQPYNISILQVSNVIIPSGIDSSTPTSPPPTPAPISSAPTYSPASSPHGSSAAPGTGTDAGPAPESEAAPAPGNDAGPAPESEAAETPTEASPAPAPHHLPPKSDAPTAETPASGSADAPSAGAPSSDTPSAGAPSAGAPEADAPSAGAPEADAPAPTSTGDNASASSILGVSLVFIAMTNLFLVLVI